MDLALAMSSTLSAAGSLKSKRKPNFTEVENLFLIEEFERNKEVLRSKVNSTEINRQKLDVWQRICDKLNGTNPIVKRSVDEVRRKWKNMVTTARKETTTFNPSRPPSQVSQRIMRGYNEPECSNNSLVVSPLGSESSTSGGMGVDVIIQEENSDTVKEEIPHSNDATIDLNEVGPRIAEVRAAVGCGMEVVEPGPPAAALTDHSRPSMRIQTSSRMNQFRPKRNNVQSIIFNAKKRKLQANQSMCSTSTSFDIQQLQKEKLTLEKEKIVLEKEKLMLEKEKLMLEIQCLRSQLNGDESEY